MEKTYIHAHNMERIYTDGRYVVTMSVEDLGTAADAERFWTQLTDMLDVLSDDSLGD